MHSPFPGMNPYLEQPEIWSQVHKWLTILIAQTLNPQLRPKYRVAIEERVYEAKGDDSLLVGIPDDVVVQSSQTTDKTNSLNIAVATPTVKPMKITLPMTETVREWYLEVRKVETGEVITVIEILSPKNKRSGEGRIKYESKREKILDSLTHLVEIDLLRQGKPMPMNGQEIQSHYRIVVSRSSERPKADLYAFNLQQEIPSFPLPLQPEDTEPVINLQELLHRLYEQGSYDLAIAYHTEPIPPLSTADAAWVDKVLREQGLR
ncbi:MAG TPA: hypothetical protein DCE56_22305 [Cyanobacteria bacterium UBA8553]|nr:hypothetical protein [Cyanobacteria bacterium UBA8553]